MVLPVIAAGLIGAGMLTQSIYSYNAYQENVRFWNNYAKKRGLTLKYPYRHGLVYNPSGVFYGSAGFTGASYKSYKNYKQMYG